MKLLRWLEIGFATVMYATELLLDYFRVHFPGKALTILGAIGFVFNFVTSMTACTGRYRDGKYCINWIHIIGGVVTVLASLIEFLLIYEFIDIEWFTEYPTIIARWVLEFNVAEALVMEAYTKLAKAPLEPLTPLPTLENLRIFGELKEGKAVVLIGIVTGDLQATIVEWYPTGSSTSEIELGIEPSKHNVYEAFTIPLEAVGRYLVAKVIPMTSDGRTGEPLFAKSEKTIEAGLPCCTSLLVSGSLIEGEVLIASYEYTGGQQGISYLNWYLHEVNFYSKLAS